MDRLDAGARPDTGKIKWGYQYTPNDGWDYDGMATPILVDTTIDGKPTKAAILSNRNGFFYAIDRTDGHFLYAFPLVETINWTTGLDPKTGKPTINEDMKPMADGKTVEMIVPVLEGGTNWFPPAYDPSSGFSSSLSTSGGWVSRLGKRANCNTTRRRVSGRRLQMYRMGDTIGHLKAIDVR